MFDIRSQRESGLPNEMADPFFGGRMIKWVRSDDRTGFILFMLELNQQFLEQATVWQLDGTFKCAPRSFAQCLNIMGVNMIRKTYVPAAHILMEEHAMWSLGVFNLPLNTQIKEFNDFLATTCGDQLRNMNCHLH